MPVKKFHDVSKMEGNTWHEPGDPRLFETIRAVWELAARSTRPRFPLGVYKHRSIEQASQLQEGDPEPVKMKVPAVEPEQTSTKAPPCQPMDDVRPGQPSTAHVWVTGYWWWSNQSYLWVPGYWATPPHAGYLYVSGHWTYKETQWVYIRGGWAKPNTTAIVVYPVPRPVLTALVITAPIRIACRHYSWGYYPGRGVQRRVDRRVDRRVIRRNERRRDR